MNSQVPAGVQPLSAAQRRRDRRPLWTGAAPSLADGFIARPETGHALGTTLVPGATVALVSDRAVPGTRNWRDSAGKTQLAVSFAQSLWQASAVDMVIWITATSRAPVMSCYAEAAAAMGVGGPGDGEALAARFVSWLRQTSRPWLIVLDDLTTATLLDRLWPEGPAGRVLITTTHPAALSGHRALILPVGSFSRREALTYLVGRITTDLDQRQGAIDLVTDLDQEPLALAQASAVIASSELTCHDYRDHFTRRREQMSAPGSEKPDAPATAITWTLSVDHADILSPGTAQSLLMLAALLDGNSIPGAVFTTSAACEYVSASGTIIRGALAALEQAGLLRLNPAAAGGPGKSDAAPHPVMQMSWLVQAAIRAAIADGLGGAAKAAADALVEVWPADDQPEWLARSVRSCADTLRRVAGDTLWEGGCHALMLRTGDSLEAARLTGAAVAYWSELAATSSRLLGREHPVTLGISERLGRAYLTAGRAIESVPLFEWIRNDRTHRLGPDHPETIAACRDLGNALVTAGRLDEAVTTLHGVVDGYDRSLGADSIEATAAREDLATAYQASSRSGDAIQLYQRAVGQRERIQGARHPDTLTARQKLAETYLADGQTKTAISQYKRLISDRERVLGRDHLQAIAARGALGSAYHAAGRMASAVQLYEQARTDYTRAIGADHPDTLGACVSLAHAYYAVGRVTDAEKLLRDTVGRCELSLPASDPLTATARTSLTNITGEAT
jgi:tetratricopeptide (TPR) repeat protein